MTVSRLSGLVLVSLLLLPACGASSELSTEELAAKIARKLDTAEGQIPNNRLKEARESYQWVLSKAPANARAHQGLGRIALDEKDWVTAEAELNKAIATQANDPETHGALGALYRKTERWAQAAGAFAKAHELDPENATYALRWGATLRKAGKAAEAETVLREVGENDPEEKFVWTELGDALRDQNKLDAALKVYMKAQKTYASDKGARVGAAAVYESKGEHTLAINELSEYVRMDCCSHYSDDVVKPKLDALRQKEQDALGDKPPHAAQP